MIVVMLQQFIINLYKLASPFFDLMIFIVLLLSGTMIRPILANFMMLN